MRKHTLLLLSAVILSISAAHAQKSARPPSTYPALLSKDPMSDTLILRWQGFLNEVRSNPKNYLKRMGVPGWEFIEPRPPLVLDRKLCEEAFRRARHQASIGRGGHFFGSHYGESCLVWGMSLSLGSKLPYDRSPDPKALRDFNPFLYWISDDHSTTHEGTPNRRHVLGVEHHYKYNDRMGLGFARSRTGVWYVVFLSYGTNVPQPAWYDFSDRQKNLVWDIHLTQQHRMGVDTCGLKKLSIPPTLPW